MDFYYFPISAPCRAVMLTASSVGVKLNMNLLDLMKQEQKKPEFVAINPEHSVPTIVDGDFTLWESRAICAYLVNKYGKDDSLYPKEAKTRALVDRLLYFDACTLSKRFLEWIAPVIFKGETSCPEKLKAFKESIGLLNNYIGSKDYVAGSSLTIADHSLVATMSTAQAAGVELSSYPNVVAWLRRCKTTIPGYQLTQEGADKFGALAKSKLT